MSLSARICEEQSPKRVNRRVSLGSEMPLWGVLASRVGAVGTGGMGNSFLLQIGDVQYGSITYNASQENNGGVAKCQI